MIQVAELADEAVDGTQRIVSTEWDARGLPARWALVFYSLKMQLLHSRPMPSGPDAKESRPWCHSQHGLVDVASYLWVGSLKTCHTYCKTIHGIAAR